MTKLTSQECLALADVIGDTPTTVISASRLQQGMCDAYIAGTLSNVTAALVFDAYCPDEPCGFGSDADALWQLLKATDGWGCVNVESVCAEPLGALIEADMDTPVRYYGDVCHALLAPVHCIRVPNPSHEVRLLTLEDAERLSKASAEVQGNGYKTHAAMINRRYRRWSRCRRQHRRHRAYLRRDRPTRRHRGLYTRGVAKKRIFHGCRISRRARNSSERQSPGLELW